MAHSENNTPSSFLLFFCATFLQTLVFGETPTIRESIMTMPLLPETNLQA